MNEILEYILGADSSWSSITQFCGRVIAAGFRREQDDITSEGDS
jgi:hypothetical protein